MKPHEERLKFALDESRMQMLGAQVLFGFQLQSLFQDGFQDPSSLQRAAAAFAFVAILATLGLLITVPAYHRLAEDGGANARMYNVASQLAEAALLPFSAALALDVLAVWAEHFNIYSGFLIALFTCVGCLLLWYAFPRYLRRAFRTKRDSPMSEFESSSASLHAKIDFMLTEARVVLPGTQALLGFQFIVMMTKAFGQLPEPVKLVHFTALSCVAVAICLLIAPAAIHRLTFFGRDDERFLRIGSAIVTTALIPFAISIAGDLYIAVWKLYGNETWAWISAAIAFLILATLWYGIPLLLRTRKNAR
jgi:uncharacterized membrane protein